MKLGNVNNSSINEIWNSDKYQKIRKIVYSKNYEKISMCGTCTKIQRM